MLTYGIGIGSLLLPLPISMAFVILALWICGAVFLHRRLVNPAVLLLIGVIVVISIVNAATTGNTPFGPESRRNLYPTALVLLGMLVDQKTMWRVLRVAFVLALLDCCFALYLYFFNDDRFSLFLAARDPTFEAYVTGSGLRRASGFSLYSIVTAGNAFFAFLYALWHGVNSHRKMGWAILAAVTFRPCCSRNRGCTFSHCFSASWMLLRHRQVSLLHMGLVLCCILGVGLAGFFLVDASDQLQMLNRWSFAESDNGFEDHGVFHVEGINAIRENLLGYGPGYASATFDRREPGAEARGRVDGEHVAEVGGR